MDKPDLKAKLEAEGLNPMPMTSEQFAQLVKSDTERWGQLTRSLSIKAN
jgi:tripartite-type tricarboxylate transporter receptor subunit TctC